MSLQAGELGAGDEFVQSDCMAFKMEEALFRLTGPPPDPDDRGKKGRRQFFIAISEGVIEYLKEHDEDSIRVRASGEPIEIL